MINAKTNWLRKSYKLLVVAMMVTVTSLHSIQPAYAASFNAASVMIVSQSAGQQIQFIEIKAQLTSTYTISGANNLYFELGTTDGDFDFSTATIDTTDISIYHGATEGSTTNSLGVTSATYADLVSSPGTNETIQIRATIPDGTEITAGTWVMIRIDGTTVNTDLPDNPASTGVYTLNLRMDDDATGVDSIEEKDVNVTILSTIAGSATIDDSLTVAIDGTTLGNGNCGNRTTDTTGTTTPTGMNWNSSTALTVGTKYYMCQKITTTTSALYGYTGVIIADAKFNNTAGDEISPYHNDDGTSGETAASASFNPLTPFTVDTSFDTPAGTQGSPATYGHYAYGTDDSDVFSQNQTGFAAVSETQDGVFAYSNAAISSDITYVQYGLTVTALQAPGVYTNSILYTIVPKY